MAEQHFELQQLQELESLMNATIPEFRWSGEIGLKLERMQSLVELLGNPQSLYQTVHVGGTSGKGTVAAMTAAILSSYGQRTGLHLSPFVETLTETWQLDGHYALPSHVMPVARRVISMAESVPTTATFGPVSYFEIKVAIAFQLFAEEAVQTAVVEVGLGGERDATNVVEPGVTVLTNVGLDHTDILGNTVEEIATDKVGIFKKGSIIVSGVEQPTVKLIARDRAAEVGARLLILDDDITYTSAATELIIECDNLQVVVEVPSDWPEFQRRNAALAVVAAYHTEPSLDPETMSCGLKAVRLPGRFESFEESGRTVILDGAHNPDKIRSTIASVVQRYPEVPCAGVVALKENKDVGAIMAELARLCSSLTLTTFNAGIWKSIAPEELAASLDTLGYTGKVVVEADPHAALSAALGNVPSEGVVLVTGSLYLAGNVRFRWVPLIDDLYNGASFRI